MSHQFYIQNGTRRSAQAFPVSLSPGAKYNESKDTFADMLGCDSDQLVRLTTVDGGIVLPGSPIPEEPLILEVQKATFDKLTGAEPLAAAAPRPKVPLTVMAMILLPAIIIFVMFFGYVIILGGLASASHQCHTNDVSAWMFANLFAWGSNTEGAMRSGISLKMICGLGLSLFWFIIMLQLLMVIIPAGLLLFGAHTYSADLKGSWAYAITCTLTILTALLCFEAFIVVPGAYYAQVIDMVYLPSTPDVGTSLPAKYVMAVQVMAAGVIILLVANFAWIYTQAAGKMLPNYYPLVMLLNKPKAPAAAAPAAESKAVIVHSV